jgi:predicted RNA-binding Zn-ribbon protein involved in translation (DUF1610 family)
MSDFTTMQCPNCGGQLTFSTNALSMRCQHCGTEHMVRQDSGGIVLESYARCPMCNRNDRAEKVSAILRSQTHNVHTTTIHTKTTMVKLGNNYIPVEQKVEVPTNSSQTSDLAALLAPPQKPVRQHQEVKVRQSYVSVLFATITGIMSFCMIAPAVLSIAEGDWSGVGINFLIAIFPTGIFGILIFIAYPNEMKQNKQNLLLAESKQKEYEMVHTEEIKRWERTMERWRSLYYCGRDDCVFIPGEKGHAPAHQMIEFLYRE